jgi:hypothetical protein
MQNDSKSANRISTPEQFLNAVTGILEKMTEQPCGVELDTEYGCKKVIVYGVVEAIGSSASGDEILEDNIAAWVIRRMATGEETFVHGDRAALREFVRAYLEIYEAAISGE